MGKPVRIARMPKEEEAALGLSCVDSPIFLGAGREKKRFK